MSVFLSDSDFTLYNGDAVESLEQLPAESVQMCVTSPPFFGLRDYGVENQIGLEETPEQWVSRLVDVFREVRRVLRADGTLWVECGDSYAGSWGAQSRRLSEPDDRMELGSATTSGSESLSANQIKAHPHRTRTGSIPHGASYKPKDLIGQPFLLAQALRAPYYTGRIKDERDRIWLAAMVDAEGCIHIHRRKAGTRSYSKFSKKDGTDVEYVRKNDTYGVMLEVSNTSRAILERCVSIYGGKIRQQTPEQNERRKQTIYRWTLTGNAPRELLRELYPHLVAKQREARIAYHCKSNDGAEAHVAIKALHNGQPTDFDAPAPETMFEPGFYWRNTCIWAKKNCMPESVRDRFTVSHSYVLLFSKQPRYFFDAEAVREELNPATILRDKTPRGRRQNGGGSIESMEGQPYRDDLGNMQSNPAGRNARSVWTIATQPLPFEHYAAFPEALARRCILAGTSERGCCPECGAPWTRETSEDYTPNKRGQVAPHSATEGDGMKEGRAGAQIGAMRMDKHVTTMGWRPSCDHNHDPVPCTVLDPFMGSGTTALVARKHGLRAVGIELNTKYCDLAAKRTEQQSLLAEGAT